MLSSSRYYCIKKAKVYYTGPLARKKFDAGTILFADKIRTEFQVKKLMRSLYKSFCHTKARPVYGTYVHYSVRNGRKNDMWECFRVDGGKGKSSYIWMFMVSDYRIEELAAPTHLKTLQV